MAEPLEYRVLRLLSDREFRSGEALARILGVTRATVWNAIRKAEAMGVAVDRTRGSGYRLAAPIGWLDAAEIRRGLGERQRAFVLQIEDEVDSTSSRLLETSETLPDRYVLATERQLAGRGRAGRVWHSTIGGGLTFSMLWRFAGGASALGGASLAVAVALVRALRGLGIADVHVKWPNDIVHSGCKLAGILIELRGDALGPTDAVIGVGVNVSLPANARQGIDQPVIDLQTIAGRVDRNRLLAAILTALDAVLVQFETSGFTALRDEWTGYHAYHERDVEVTLAGGKRAIGRVRGVGNAGELLVEMDGLQRHYVSGEIRLRSGAGRAATA
ncbi:MAG TPA: biotin--[acetyl-CoA-carboxylase] ligase [Pelomicrobium sp.]|nr:biotin--[acetyl-CoA-carboxylase] ligase [Pelomicrobium sp.]